MLNLEPETLLAIGLGDLPAAFAAMTASGAEAWLIGANARLYSYRAELLSRALAVSCRPYANGRPWREMAVSWATGRTGRRCTAMPRPSWCASSRVQRRADLPVEQPAVFSFAVNLQAPRSLASSCPPLLARAGEVIE